MWDNANHRAIGVDRVAGVMNAADGTGRVLVVEGEPLGDSGNAYFAVPLGLDGRPPSPYRYEGTARNLEAIAAEVGRAHGPEGNADDPQRVNRARLDRLPRQATDRPGAYLALAFETACEQRHRTAPTWAEANGVIVSAFRSGPGGALEPVAGRRIDQRGEPFDVVWPDDAAFVVLPATQFRTDAEMKASRLGATLLTPLTVTADVCLYAGVIAIAPVALVLTVITGAYCI